MRFDRTNAHRLRISKGKVCFLRAEPRNGTQGRLDPFFPQKTRFSAQNTGKLCQTAAKAVSDGPRRPQEGRKGRGLRVYAASSTRTTIPLPPRPGRPAHGAHQGQKIPKNCENPPEWLKKLPSPGPMPPCADRKTGLLCAFCAFSSSKDAHWQGETFFRTSEPAGARPRAANRDIRVFSASNMGKLGDSALEAVSDGLPRPPDGRERGTDRAYASSRGPRTILHPIRSDGRARGRRRGPQNAIGGEKPPSTPENG